MGVTELVFELYALKAKIKGVFRSYCCYGNLLSHKINSNLFPDDCTVCWYHDVGDNKYRVVIITHQTLSLEKYWKLFPATLRTSAPIVSAYPYCARKFTHVMHKRAHWVIKSTSFRPFLAPGYRYTPEIPDTRPGNSVLTQGAKIENVSWGSLTLF